MNTKPAAILFDLDDTILECDGGDFLKLWQDSVNKHIHLFPSLDPKVFFTEIRKVADEFWNDPERHRKGRLNILESRKVIIGQAAKNLGHQHHQGVSELANHYHQRREFNVVPYKGAIETLEYFRKLPIKTALITNGGADIQRSKIEKYDLAKYFDLIIIEGEFGMGKPNPEVYLHSVKVLGLKPKDSWIIGDNLEGEVRVPQSLGFFTIWNDFRKEGVPLDRGIIPDRVVHNVSELVDLYHKY
jgi:putative hydrolase of the HAD superfamily